MPARPDIEVDAESGEIRIYDSRPRLRRVFIYWWVFAITGAIMAVASTVTLLLVLLKMRGLAYAIKGVAHLVLGLVPAAGIGAGMFLLGLYRQARVLRRHRDPQPDLILSPQGLEDRWLGLGLIPWHQIVAAELHMQRPLNRPGIALRFNNLTGWIDSLCAREKRHLRRKLWLADRFGDRIRLSQTGGETFGLSFYDLLYALACYIPVSGLPIGYRPEHAGLHGLKPPPDNLFRPPEMALEQIDITPVELREKSKKTKTVIAALCCFGFVIFLISTIPEITAWGWGAHAVVVALIVILVISSVVCLRALFRPAPFMIRADKDGLILWPYRHYPCLRWTDILDFENSLQHDRFTLYVDLRDISQYDQMLPPWWRLCYQCRRWFGGSLRIVLLEPEGSVQVAMERIRALHTRARAQAAALLLQDPTGNPPSV